MPRPGFLVESVVLEVEYRGGVVTSTLGERFPPGEMPKVLSVPHTSLKRKEVSVRQSRCGLKSEAKYPLAMAPAPVLPSFYTLSRPTSLGPLSLHTGFSTSSQATLPSALTMWTGGCPAV